MSTRRPFIGIPADRRLVSHHHVLCIGEKHFAGVAEGAQAEPASITLLGDGLEAPENGFQENRV